MMLEHANKHGLTIIDVPLAHAFTEAKREPWLIRIWPDGTHQAVAEGEPYPHMSDDFQLLDLWDFDAFFKLSPELQKEIEETYVGGNEDIS